MEIKIYNSNNSVLIRNEFASYTFDSDGDLSATRDGDFITIKVSGTQKKIINSANYSVFKNRNGSALGGTSAATLTAINGILNASNPSGFANKTTVDILARGLKQVPVGADDKFILSVDNTATSGKLQVIDREARMNVGDTELKIEDTRSTLSVKSNYANSGSEQKSDAIVVSGNESTVGSTVEIKGKLKLGRSSESSWTMTNGDINESVYFSGSSSWLEFPSISSSNTANKLIRGAVTVGDTEDTVRGGRNYFTVSGLSSGDTVNVEVGVYVDSSAANTVILDDNRSPGSDSSASSVAGITTHTVTMTNTVDDFSDIQYHLNLDTTGSGYYRVTSIDVTIS